MIKNSLIYDKYSIEENFIFHFLSDMEKFGDNDHYFEFKNSNFISPAVVKIKLLGFPNGLPNKIKKSTRFRKLPFLIKFGYIAGHLIFELLKIKKQEILSKQPDLSTNNFYKLLEKKQKIKILNFITEINKTSEDNTINKIKKRIFINEISFLNNINDKFPEFKNINDNYHDWLTWKEKQKIIQVLPIVSKTNKNKI